MSEPRADLPKAKVAGRSRPWLGWVIALAMVPPGWFLIGHANRWHLTSPVIVLALGWLALVGAGYTLVRAANATVEPITDDWFAAAGSRDELEREKRNLIRSIKDVEFDRDTGKVTAADAQQQIAMFRARAIEVIKALDEPGSLSPRERVLAELAARIKVDRVAGKGKAGKGKAGKGKADKKSGDAEAAKPSADAPAPTDAPTSAPEAEEVAAPAVARDADQPAPPPAVAAAAPAASTEEAAS